MSAEIPFFLTSQILVHNRACSRKTSLHSRALTKALVQQQSTMISAKALPRKSPQLTKCKGVILPNPQCDGLDITSHQLYGKACPTCAMHFTPRREAIIPAKLHDYPSQKYHLNLMKLNTLCLLITSPRNPEAIK